MQLMENMIKSVVKRHTPIGLWLHLKNALQAIILVGSDDEARAASLLLQSLEQDSPLEMESARK